MKRFRKDGSSRRLQPRAVVLAAVLVSLTVPEVDAAAQAPSPCCFTNPAHNGTCVVKPGDQETCKSILDYLNNPNSSGKTYCGGTTVRGGWKEVKCPQALDAKRERNTLPDRARMPACAAPGPGRARVFK